jgi:hypothetical protein
MPPDNSEPPFVDKNRWFKMTCACGTRHKFKPPQEWTAATWYEGSWNIIIHKRRPVLVWYKCTSYRTVDVGWTRIDKNIYRKLRVGDGALRAFEESKRCNCKECAGVEIPYE